MLVCLNRDGCEVLSIFFFINIVENDKVLLFLSCKVICINSIGITVVVQ